MYTPKLGKMSVENLSDRNFSSHIKSSANAVADSIRRVANARITYANIVCITVKVTDIFISASAMRVHWQSAVLARLRCVDLNSIVAIIPRFGDSDDVREQPNVSIPRPGQ
jgi:hypothetical protein